jgi:hypothetical protein
MFLRYAWHNEKCFLGQARLAKDRRGSCGTAWGPARGGEGVGQAPHADAVVGERPTPGTLGGPPGASLSMADAALVTEDTLAALRNTLFLTRVPATSSAGGRGMAEAGAHHPWEEVGGLAQTPPPRRRPGTCSHVSERRVTF